MTVNLIAAIGRSDQVGLDGKLPWHRPDDLAWFKEMTMGGIVLAGHRTWSALPDLPGRKLLLWHDRNGATPRGVLDRLQFDNLGTDIWIAGGPATWRVFAPFIERVFISRIDYDGPADAWFPFDAFDFPTLPYASQLVEWRRPS